MASLESVLGLRRAAFIGLVAGISLIVRGVIAIHAAWKALGANSEVLYGDLMEDQKALKAIGKEL